MSGSVPVEAEIKTKIPGKDSTGKITVPTTMTDIHNSAVNIISDNLNQAGHPKTSGQVSAHGEPDAVLAQIEGENIGTQVINAGGDRLAKGFENLGGDVGGSKREYHAPGGSGFGIAMRRMAGRVLESGIPARIRHLLFRQNKTR